MLAGLGRWAARRRVPVLAAWVLVTLAGAVFGGAVFDRTQPVGSLRSHTESAAAQARIDELSPDGEMIVAVLSGRHFNATDLVDNASRVMFDIRAIPGAAEVTDSYTTDAHQASDDSQKSLVTVELRQLLAERRFGEQAIADAAFGESVALVVLVAVLVVLLGGLAAGRLPLTAALAIIAAAVIALSVLAGAIPGGEYADNGVTLLGTGLAVDYKRW